MRVLDKWVLLATGSLLTGALVFAVHVSPRLRREGGPDATAGFERWQLGVASLSLAVLAVAGFGDLLLQAVDIDTSIGSVLGTTWGERWLLRHLLLIPLALLLLGLWAGLANARLLASGGLLLAGGYLLLTSSVSHAGAGAGSFWAIGADFAHLTASSVWIGTLAVLALLFFWSRRHLEPRTRHPLLATGLQRFSVLAVASVALLLFTGTINAIVELARFSDLLDSGYGRALALKLILLLPLLGIGAYNAYLLRPDFVEAADPQTNVRDRQGLLQDLEHQLGRRVLYEAGVALVVFAVVALLVQLTPTRGRLATPEQSGGEFIETREVEDLQVTLSISPNEPGINTFEVYLAGGVDIVESLRLEFINPTGFGSDSRLILEESNPPTFYIGQGPYLPEPGEWTIILNIRRSEGTDLRVPFTDQVAGTAGTEAASRSTGGAFSSPIEFDTASVALLAVSAGASLVIVLGSVRRPGLPEGYLGWFAAEAAYRLAPVNMKPVWTLGVLIATGIGLGLLIGSHVDQPLSSEEASRENPIEATEESIARGRMLFMNDCARCHGESGRGDGPLAPTLPIQPANLYNHIPFHPDQFFFGVISKGLSGVMPAFEDQLSEEDRWHILNYLRDRFTAEPTNR